MKCPHCKARVDEARAFRQTTTSQLIVYRWMVCDGIYNLYSATVFEQKQLTPAQAVLLLRGVCQGVPSAQLAREIGLSRPTVMALRRALQTNAQAMQPDALLADEETETDEMFQVSVIITLTTGGKSKPHPDSSDPPRRRANYCNL